MLPCVVRVRDNNLERAMLLFKKKMSRDGILAEVSRKQKCVTKSERKKLKLKNAEIRRMKNLKRKNRGKQNYGYKKNYRHRF